MCILYHNYDIYYSRSTILCIYFTRTKTYTTVGILVFVYTLLELRRMLQLEY